MVKTFGDPDGEEDDYSEDSPSLPPQGSPIAEIAHESVTRSSLEKTGGVAGSSHAQDSGYAAWPRRRSNKSSGNDRGEDGNDRGNQDRKDAGKQHSQRIVKHVDVMPDGNENTSASSGEPGQVREVNMAKMAKGRSSHGYVESTGKQSMEKLRSRGRHQKHLEEQLHGKHCAVHVKEDMDIERDAMLHRRRSSPQKYRSTARQRHMQIGSRDPTQCTRGDAYQGFCDSAQRDIRAGKCARMPDVPETQDQKRRQWEERERVPITKRLKPIGVLPEEVWWAERPRQSSHSDPMPPLCKPIHPDEIVKGLRQEPGPVQSGHVQTSTPSVDIRFPETSNTHASHLTRRRRRSLSPIAQVKRTRHQQMPHQGDSPRASRDVSTIRTDHKFSQEEYDDVRKLGARELELGQGREGSGHGSDSGGHPQLRDKRKRRARKESKKKASNWDSTQHADYVSSGSASPSIEIRLPTAPTPPPQAAKEITADMPQQNSTSPNNATQVPLLHDLNNYLEASAEQLPPPPPPPLKPVLSPYSEDVAATQREPKIGPSEAKRLAPPPPAFPQRHQLDLGLRPDHYSMHTWPSLETGMSFNGLCTLANLPTLSASVTSPLVSQLKAVLVGSMDSMAASQRPSKETWTDVVGWMHGLDEPLGVGSPSEDAWLQDQQQRRRSVFHCGEVLKALRVGRPQAVMGN
jgi:hypothetical protein